MHLLEERASAGAPGVVTEGSPRTLRITKADGSRVTLREVRIALDTLTGLGGRGDTMRVALTEVMQLERRALDPARTVLVGVLIVGSIATFAEMQNAEFGPW
jgi:hypothetical protein